MSMNESCDKVRERVSLWLDHQLPAGERASIGAHLDVCVGCRGEFETYAALSRRVRALEPDDLSDTFASEIRSLAIGPPKPIAWWQRPATTRVAAGVLVCLGLALSYYLGHESGVDKGGASADRPQVMGKEISYDMQTRAARSVLGDLAVIDRIPKTYRQPVLASQYKRFRLERWIQAPETAKDPMLAQAADILRQLGAAIDSPNGLKGTRLARLKSQAAKLSSNGWRFESKLKRSFPRGSGRVTGNDFFASNFGGDHNALIREVAPQCSDQDQKNLNSLLNFKECVAIGDPFSAVMICRDVDVSSSFGSVFQVVVGQHMEDVGMQIRWNEEAGAKGWSGFSIPPKRSSAVPGKMGKRVVLPETLDARLKQLFADKLDGELIIEETLEEEEGSQSLRITIIRGDK